MLVFIVAFVCRFGSGSVKNVWPAVGGCYVGTLGSCLFNNL